MDADKTLERLGAAGALPLISSAPRVIHWRRDWGSPLLQRLLAADGYAPGPEPCTWGGVAEFIRRQREHLEVLGACLTHTLGDIEVFEVGAGPVKRVYAVGHLSGNARPSGWAGLKFTLGWPP